MSKTKKILAGLFLTLPILLIGEGLRENRQLDSESIIITSQHPHNQEVKIAHLSDLQFPRIRVNQQRLLEELIKEQPDVVFITGDTIDRTENVEHTEFFSFLEKITTHFPTYVINGNHEETNPDYALWLQRMKQSHAVYLENTLTTLTIKDRTFNLIGLSNRQTTLPNDELKKLDANLDTLILAHHPELFADYVTSFNNPLAVFSGHAHGGQWRLPLTDGLLAPDQGFFPKLTSGLYIKDNSHLIVSRGLANSTFPLRINNYPHLIFTTLK